jgi:cytochrome c oxidase subunit 1
VLIRLELLTPAGRPVSAETYNKLFTMHGVMMVFFFLIPSIPRCSATSCADHDRREGPGVPEAQPAELVHLHDRRLFTLYAIVTGGVDTGWTFYTPYSTHVLEHQRDPAALGIFITGFSSILTGLNFIVTIHRCARRA